MSTLPDLNDLLEYQNPLVIKRFKQNHPNDAERSDILFSDMLRYLWLCEKHESDRKKNPSDPRLDFIPVMHEEMRAIDNMWHEFILITRDYQQFCLQYFGYFLHHEPNMNEQLNYSEQEFFESLQLFLSYVYDELGQEVLMQWFGEHLEIAA